MAVVSIAFIATVDEQREVFKLFDTLQGEYCRQLCSMLTWSSWQKRLMVALQSLPCL